MSHETKLMSENTKWGFMKSYSRYFRACNFHQISYNLSSPMITLTCSTYTSLRLEYAHILPKQDCILFDCLSYSPHSPTWTTWSMCKSSFDAVLLIFAIVLKHDKPRRVARYYRPSLIIPLDQRNIYEKYSKPKGTVKQNVCLCFVLADGLSL